MMTMSIDDAEALSPSLHLPLLIYVIHNQMYGHHHYEARHAIPLQTFLSACTKAYISHHCSRCSDAASYRYDDQGMEVNRNH